MKDPSSARELISLHRKWGGSLFLQTGHRPDQPQTPPRHYWLIFDHSWRPGQNHLSRALRISDSWAMSLRLEETPTYRRTLECFSLTFILKGEGLLLLPNTTYPLRAGDLLILFPGIPHAYGPPPGKRWDEFSLFFGGPVFNAWQGIPPLDPARPVLSLKPTPYWLERFQALVLPIARSRTPLGPRHWIHLLALLSEMAESVSETEKSETRWFERARALLNDQHNERQLPWPEIARSMGTSERTFRRRFLRLAGCTPARFHEQLRFTEARRLLLETDLKISTIAQRLSFANEYHFSRRFKQVVGLSPRAFRLEYISH